MRSWIHSIQRGLGFFTRLPSGHYDPAALGESAAVFPVIGLIIGALASLFIAFATFIHLPPTIGILLGISAAIIITGGLHEDGLADTADALGARGDREKRILILKDSRIGAFGAIALILALLIKLETLSGLPSSWHTMTYFICAHILGRGILPTVMRSAPLMSNEGMAAAAGQPSVTAARTALIISFILVLLLMGPVKSIVAFGAAILTGLLLIRIAYRIFGGYNGDVLGAIEQCVELAVLINLRSFAT